MNTTNRIKLFSVASVVLVFSMFLTVFANAAPTMYGEMDFQNLTLAATGSTVHEKFTITPNAGSNAEIKTENANKYLSLSRTSGSNVDCLVEFYQEKDMGAQYIVQYDAKLDPNVTNGGNVYLLYGRKQTASGGKFEYLVTLTADGKIGTGSNPAADATFATLSATKFTNIAIAINDQAKTYSVYIDGVKKVDNRAFATNGYEGVPSSVQTRLRISLNTATYNAALQLDNLKVYEGNTLKVEDTTAVTTATTTTATTTAATTTAGGTTTSPTTGDSAILYTVVTLVFAGAAITIIKMRKRATAA